jgi:hypothetical protein
MLSEVDGKTNGIVGPDQKDREYFNGSKTEDSPLEGLARFFSNRWGRVGTAGIVGTGFVTPEVVLAQQVNTDQVVAQGGQQKPSAFVSGSLNEDFNRITHRQPLSDSDQNSRANLLEIVNGKSGVLKQTPGYKIEYVAAADDVEVTINAADADNAKKEVERWFTQDQGLSQAGVCNLPVVFGLGIEPSQEFINSPTKFNPIPDGCSTITASPDGDRPDTNVAYQQSYDAITRQNLANPDPKEAIAHLRPELPIQDPFFSFTYDYKSNKFNLTIKRGREAEAQQAFYDFLGKHNIDPKDLTNLNVQTQ